MRKLQQRPLHSRVLLTLLSLTLTLLLFVSGGINLSDATHANTYRYYQRAARVYEHRSAQYVNPALIRQQLEQRKRDAELAWQRRLAEMARIRSDAELKARELKIRNEWQRKWRQYK